MLNAADLPMVKGRDNTVHSADEYAHRCCGLVFFPRDMAITRNKMKLLHEHDSLSAALRGSDERQRPGNCLWRRSSAESVRQWLVKCHEHDKEVEVRHSSCLCVLLLAATVLICRHTQR
jgi:hypothetical protein